MFEKLLDKLIELWEDIVPWCVLSQFEAGVVVRLGRYKKTLHVGVNFKFPFIDDIYDTNILPKPMPLRAQTLTSNDGKSVVVSSTLRYRIHDAKSYLLNLEDAPGILRDTALGAVKSVISDTNLAKMNDTSTEQQVLDIVQGELRKYGITIIRVVFVDLGAIRSYRLISNPDEYAEDDD